MSADALSFLAARSPAPPPALAAALRAALAADVEMPLAAELAEAAMRELRTAIALGDERAAAYPLLVADALLTYALEAAAEQGMESVEAVVETWEPAFVARCLEPDTV